jgi:hypothetical protein
MKPVKNKYSTPSFPAKHFKGHEEGRPKIMEANFDDKPNGRFGSRLIDPDTNENNSNESTDK